VGSFAVHPFFRRRFWLLVAPAAALVVAACLGLILHFLLGAQGDEWRQAGLSGDTVHFFAFGHRRSGLAFAGTDGGVYRRDPSGSWHLALSAEAVWSVELFTDDRTVVAGDEAGDVDVSRDAGKTWRRSFLTSDGVYAVSIRPGQSRWLLAGAGGGMYISRDGGRHWQRRLRLHSSAGTAFAWEPGSAMTVFAGVVAGAANGETQVFISRDAGMHWRVFGRGLGSRAGIMSLAAQGAQVYAGTMGNLIWALPISGVAWRQLGNGLPAGQHVSGIAAVPTRRMALYIATLGAGVFRSQDAGRHWSGESGGLPSDGGQQLVLTVAYAPLEHAIYAGTLEGAYKLPL